MSIVTALQVAVSVALIGLILMQERSSGASGLFGGTEGGFYQTRRGIERFAYTGTIVLIVVFAGLSLVNLLR